MTEHNIDLDAVARPDIRVQLNGKKWRIPGGPRSEVVAKMGALFTAYQAAAQDEDAQRVSEIAEEIKEEVVALFAQRHSDAELEELPDLDDEQLATLYLGIINTWSESPSEADEPRPTRATTPTRNRSRSSVRKPAPKAQTPSASST